MLQVLFPCRPTSAKRVIICQATVLPLTVHAGLLRIKKDPVGISLHIFCSIEPRHQTRSERDISSPPRSLPLCISTRSNSLSPYLPKFYLFFIYFVFFVCSVLTKSCLPSRVGMRSLLLWGPEQPLPIQTQCATRVKLHDATRQENHEPAVTTIHL